MDIIDTPQEVLIAKIQYLDNVRKLAGQLQTDDPEEIQQSISLMEKIGRDMDLYQHFANQDVGKLTDIVLDTIEDEVVGIIGSDILSNPSLGGYTSSRRGSMEPSIRHVTSKHSLRSVPSLATMNNHDGALSCVPPSPSGVFKWTLFRHLTIFLAKPEFQKYGSSTCFVISSVVAIGTTSSVILVFDLAQALKCELGGVTKKTIYGPVTCLAFSPDHNQIVAGYQNGFICLWDVKKKVLLKEISPVNDPAIKDGHRTGAPISMVSIPLRDVFFTSDEDGAAFYHILLNRILYYDVKSTRIHGKVRSIQDNITSSTTILSMTAPQIDYIRFPGDSNYLVAITSPYKLAIVAMKPIPQILFRMSWSQFFGDGEEVVKVENAETDWYVPSKQQRATCVFLAVGFACNLRIFKIDWKIDGGTKKRLRFEIIAKGICASAITSINWMTSKFIAVTTASQELHIFETQNLDLVEKTSIRPHFTDTRKEKDRYIYHHNIATFKNRLFILSQNEMWFASLLTWQDRLGVLIRSGNFERAFEIGVNLSRGKYVVAVLGLPENDEDRSRIVADHIGGLLINLVSMTLSGYEERDPDLGQYRYICKLVINTCLDLGQNQLIYGEIWERFVDARLSNVFLNTLQELIFRGDIKSIPNPHIVSEMFDAIDPILLEQVIMQLDPFSLDIHNCLSLCRENGLTKAMIHIYNTALSDYISPVLEIISRIEARVSTRDEDVYTLFVYFAYILQGKAFPFGELDAERSKIVYRSVFSLLCSQNHITYPNAASPIREQGCMAVGSGPWPYFQYLLQLETAELIKMLGAVFQNPALDSGIDLADHDQIETLLVTRQLILSILLRVLESDLWSQLQIDTINAFIGRCFFHYRTYINLSKPQMMLVFNSLLGSELDCSKHFCVCTKRDSFLLELMLIETFFLIGSKIVVCGRFMNSMSLRNGVLIWRSIRI
jgi:vacuolar protein sorting-associated protein 8